MRRWRRRHWKHQARPGMHCFTLADSPPGCYLRVVGFLEAISPEQKDRLCAYGIVPGHCVFVLQHHPVTIVRIDHTELALERELARLVKVETE